MTVDHTVHGSTSGGKYFFFDKQAWVKQFGAMTDNNEGQTSYVSFEWIGGIAAPTC